MAKFSLNDIDKYGNSGSGLNYFSLKNDKDSAKVHILYESPDDVRGDTFHVINKDGKFYYIYCPREYNEPLSVCPLCKAGHQIKKKFFIPVYNTVTEQVEIFERGANFLNELSFLFSKCPHLVDATVEITRFGKKGDMQTTYRTSIDEVGKHTIEEFGEIPDVVGTYGKVLQLTTEELQILADTGELPERYTKSNEDNNEEDKSSEIKPTNRTGKPRF